MSLLSDCQIGELDGMKPDWDNSGNAFPRVQQIECLNKGIDPISRNPSIILLNPTGRSRKSLKVHHYTVIVSYSLKRRIVSLSVARGGPIRNQGYAMYLVTGVSDRCL